MIDIRRWTAAAGLLLLVGALGGCTPKTDISMGGNAPAQYTHVYVTVQEIRFNTNATALPGATSWVAFPLTNPVTVDLVGTNAGTLAQLTTGQVLPPGTYTQALLFPVDSSAARVSSAISLGTNYNAEVDYLDSSGRQVSSTLELQNPDQGIVIPTSLVVKADARGVLSTGDSSSGTSGSGSSSSQTSVTPLQFGVSEDASRDVVPFNYGPANSTTSGGTSTGTVSGFLLNPHMSVYDSAAVGTIQGTVDISGLSGITVAGNSSYLNIQVTAEALSADGLRHVAVNSAPVGSGGTVTLYPLATSSSTPTSYDLVIHGPAIATIIVKNVPVSVGSPSSGTPVNIGTVKPRPAGSFTVNLNTTNPLPAGALVGFYQTLPGSTEVPYLIEERPIDPFSRAFASDQSIAAEGLDSGSYVSGSNVALTTATPQEGARTYRVSATAPLFNDGLLTTTPQGKSGSTAALLVAVPVPAVASGAFSSSLSVSARQSTPGKYDSGQLILSHGGAIVATAPLDSILKASGGGILTLTGLPGGTAGAIYTPAQYSVSVRTWSSADPVKSLNREIYPTIADLSGSTLSSYSLVID